MTDVEQGAEAEDHMGPELNEAIKRGMRRASMHWMRAGYEVLAGVGALLDEIATAGDTEDDDVDPGPTKINLD